MSSATYGSSAGVSPVARQRMARAICWERRGRWERCRSKSRCSRSRSPRAPARALMAAVRASSHSPSRLLYSRLKFTALMRRSFQACSSPGSVSPMDANVCSIRVRLACTSSRVRRAWSSSSSSRVRLPPSRPCIWPRIMSRRVRRSSVRRRSSLASASLFCCSARSAGSWTATSPRMRANAQSRSTAGTVPSTAGLTGSKARALPRAAAYSP